MFLKIGYLSKVKWHAAGNFLKLVLSNARRGPSPLKNSRGAFRILGGGVQNDAGGLFQAWGLVRFYRFTPPPPPLSTALNAQREMYAYIVSLVVQNCRILFLRICKIPNIYHTQFGYLKRHFLNIMINIIYRFKFKFSAFIIYRNSFVNQKFHENVELFFKTSTRGLF